MESTSPEQRGRYSVSWTRQSSVRKVEIFDTASGKRITGTDWASWDAAYQRALVQLIRQPS